MAKPSSRKTRSPQRRQAPRKPASPPVAAAPEPKPAFDPAPPVETPPATPATPGPASMFDQEDGPAPAAVVESETPPASPPGDGEDEAEGERQDEVKEQPQPNVNDQEQPAPAPDVDPAAAADEAALLAEFDAGDPPPAPSDAPSVVRMGNVEGILYRIPVGVVAELLGPDAQGRVDVLRVHSSISALQKRMRASDGRCTPIFMTEEPGEAPKLFANLEALACAFNLGLNFVSVITIRPADATALQGFLGSKALDAGGIHAKADPDDVLLFEHVGGASAA